jgi:hypothetical protein
VSEKTLKVDNLSSDMPVESDSQSHLIHRLDIWARDDLDGIASTRP